MRIDGGYGRSPRELREDVMMGLFVFLAILLATGGATPVMAGRSYYVSPNGADGNSGSVDSPWRDIEAAMMKTQPGDVLYLRAGTYLPGYSIYIRKWSGGKPGAYKIIRPYPGETAKIRKYGFEIEGSYIRIENLDFIDGAGVGFNSEAGKGFQVVNCRFRGPLGWGVITVMGDDPLVEGNVIDMQGSSMGTQGHGIYLSHGSGAVIRRNVIKGTVEGYGIHVFDQRRSQDPPSFFRRIRNVVIEGNVVTGSSNRSGIIAVAYDGAAIDNITIRNNVVYGNARHGIYVGAQASNIFIYNNTVYGNGGFPIYVDTNYSGGETSNVTIRNNILDLGAALGIDHIYVTRRRATFSADTNLYWPGPPRQRGISDSRPIVGDPMYRNAEKADFRPRPGSAAVDRGAAIPGMKRDIEGTRRPQGAAVDIGAYETEASKR